MNKVNKVIIFISMIIISSSITYFATKSLEKSHVEYKTLTKTKVIKEKITKEYNISYFEPAEYDFNGMYGFTKWVKSDDNQFNNDEQVENLNLEAGNMGSSETQTIMKVWRYKTVEAAKRDMYNLKGLRNESYHRESNIIFIMTNVSRNKFDFVHINDPSNFTLELVKFTHKIAFIISKLNGINNVVKYGEENGCSYWVYNDHLYGEMMPGEFGDYSQSNSNWLP